MIVSEGSAKYHQAAAVRVRQRNLRAYDAFLLISPLPDDHARLPGARNNSHLAGRSDNAIAWSDSMQGGGGNDET